MNSSYSAASNTQISPNLVTSLANNTSTSYIGHSDTSAAALVSNSAAYNLAMEHPQLYGFSATSSADINQYYWPNALPNSIPNAYSAGLPPPIGMQG